MKIFSRFWQRARYYWRIFWLFRRFDLMNMLVHRGDFFFWMSVGLVWTAFNYFFFGVITTISGSIGSWTSNEVYLLLSIFTIIDAFTWSVFHNNMEDYAESVFEGRLSMILIQPINTVFVLIFRRCSYTNIVRVLVGIIGVIITLRRLALPMSFPLTAATIVMIVSSLVFVYGLWFLFTTLSFWVERLQNINEIIPAFRRIWQLPREVYQGTIGVLFTIVLPIGLVSSLPAEIALGRNVWNWALYFLAFSIGLWIVAYRFFIISVRRYSSIGG